MPVAYAGQQADELVEGSGEVKDQVVVAQGLVLDQGYLRHCRKLSGIIRSIWVLPTIGVSDAESRVARPAADLHPGLLL